MFHHHFPHHHPYRFARDNRHMDDHPGEDRGQGREHGRQGWHRHGRGGGPGSRNLELGRFFAHGDLRLVILQMIAAKPRYGYELIKAIEEQAAGAYSPSPGVIYPTLTLLEELGYVAVNPGEGSRKLHEITDAGRAFLEANRAAVEALLARMEQASRTHGGGPPAPILRAMENLKLALRLRLGQGPLTAEQVNAITAALDTAATSVEQI
jgi:DNA-binding PadR family transcriptional regulator